MGKVLIVDRDTATTEALGRLLDALGISWDTVLTHTKILRAYAFNEYGAVFLSVEMPTIDIRRLVEDLESQANTTGFPRPPLILLYEDRAIVDRYRLDSIPRSRILRKPFTFEQVYPLLHAAGLTKIEELSESGAIESRSSRYETFVLESERWIDQLKSQLKLK
ncbi:hypothetical protein ACFLZR_01975 [Candidatus Neomarinimicrobiota bacterium]